MHTPHPELEKIQNLLQLIERESLNGVSLIPSENTMSSAAVSALAGVVSQRYVFDEGAVTHWPATAHVVKLRSLVEDLVKDRFSARYCSTRPLSGIHCMTIMLSLFKSMGLRKIYVVPWEFGGHGNTLKIAKRFGLEVGHLPFCSAHFDIDIDLLRKEPHIDRDCAVYVDQWISLKTPDILGLRRILGDDVYVHHDVSHLIGLIAGHAVKSPLELGADSFGGSTHKTFPGPQKGILVWNDDRLTALIEEEVGAFVSHPHTGSMAALGVSLAQFRHYGERYAEQVLMNARVCGQELSRLGVHVVGQEIGFTSTHQVVIDLPSGSDLLALGELLRAATISLNFLEPGILFCKCPLRIGLQEMTFRGMREEEALNLAYILARIFQGRISSAAAREAVVALVARSEKNAFTQ